MSEGSDQYAADCAAMLAAGERWLAAHPNASLGDARLLRALERAVTRKGVCHASGAQIEIILNQLGLKTGRSLH